MADAPKRFTTVTSGGGTFTGGTVADATTFSSAVTFSNAILMRDGDGAVANAAQFTADTNSGIYRVGADDWAAIAGALICARFRASGGIGITYVDMLTIGNTSDTALRRAAAGVVRITDAATTGAGQLALNTTAEGHRIAATLVTLTEAGGAETVVTITTAAGQMSGGRITYTVRATDATDLVARSGSFNFVCANAATVVTASLGATAQTDDGSVVIATGGATLTYAIAADVATANTLKITFNIDSSLVVSAASITYTVVLNGPGTVA